MSRLGTAIDIKEVGHEPTLPDMCTETQFLQALNWYNYVCTNDQAQAFTEAWLRAEKFDKASIQSLGKIRVPNSIGWICRILTQGGRLPIGYETRHKERVQKLLEDAAQVVSKKAAAPQESKVVVSIQERVKDKTSEVIGDLEEQLDIFFVNGKLSFDPVTWMRQKDLKPAIAQKIAEYYKPLYAELFDALQGKDPTLKEAYKHWKKPQLRAYVDIVHGFIAAAEGRSLIKKASRKPRKRKVKAPGVIVAKVKFKPEDKDYGVTSINPVELIGAQQVWLFNAKYRTLAVYNAMGPAGISVKGTTLIGFNEKVSVIKRLRKPQEQLKALQDAGKVALRKFMDGIKCKPKEGTGRLNSDTVIIKVVK